MQCGGDMDLGGVFLGGGDAAVGGATVRLTAPTSLVLATLLEEVQLLPKKPAVTLQGQN